MTMHLVRGMTSLNTKKRKMKKKPGWKNTIQEHDEFLKKMGVHPDQLAKKKAKRGNVATVDFPDLSSPSSNTCPTSDRIDGIAPRKETMKYTGDEIAGIVVTHKSNLMPVRKDNKQAAIDAASMRR